MSNRITIIIVVVNRTYGTINGKCTAVIIDSTPISVCSAIHGVTLNKVATSHSNKSSRCRVARCSHCNCCHILGALVISTSLVIVVDNVNITATRTTVAAIKAIKDDAVAQVNIFSLNSICPLILAVKLILGIFCPLITCSIETWRAIAHMGK